MKSTDSHYLTCVLSKAIMVWCGLFFLLPAGWAAVASAKTGAKLTGPPPTVYQPPASEVRPQAPSDVDGWLFSKDGHRLVDSRKQPVELRQNPSAKDVPLAKVVEFVKASQVNTLPYVTGKFVCTEFAVTLHDEAEAAGIRCGVVGVRFQRGQGHALNVFNTTDKGLVYVDCTGASHPEKDRSAYKTIAFLQVGRVYGRLPLEIGAFDPNHYERYTYVMGLWNQAATEEARLDQETRKLAAERQKFSQETRQVRQATGVSPDETQTRYALLIKQEAELDKKRQELFDRYEKVIAQFKRLRCRYDMNTAPVKTVDIWW